MKIKAKYSSVSLTGVYLITLISTVISYFIFPLDNPRTFNTLEFILWVIFGNILGLVLGVVVSLLNRRQYLLIELGVLIYQGSLSSKNMSLQEIKIIKFDFEQKNLVHIDSNITKISFLSTNFDKDELIQFLLTLMNNNKSISIDEFTKAILAKDQNSWLVHEELFVKVINFGKTMLGFILLIWLILYFVSEAYKIFDVF